MATVLGPFPISGITGPHTEGPVAMPTNVSQMNFDLDRTVGSPTINGQPSLVLSGEVEYSFDGGVTFPRADGNAANGGSMTTTGGLHGTPTGTHTTFTTHVPMESAVMQGGSPTKQPTHVRANFTVSGGTLNSSLTITLS